MLSLGIWLYGLAETKIYLTSISPYWIQLVTKRTMWDQLAVEL